MKVAALVSMDVDPKSIARALIESPEAFAQLWFHFAEIARDEQTDLENHGKAMAPRHGGMRKHPFRQIVKIMDYHEIKQSDV